MSAGLDRHSVIALVKAGFDVVGTSRNTSSLTPSVSLTYMDIDVTNDDSVIDGVQRVIEQFGRIDVLVNNAGVGSAGAAEETTIEQDKARLGHPLAGLAAVRINVTVTNSPVPLRYWYCRPQR